MGLSEEKAGCGGYYCSGEHYLGNGGDIVVIGVVGAQVQYMRSLNKWDEMG